MSTGELDLFDIEGLVKEFEDPLAPVDQAETNSQESANAELEKLTFALNTQSRWQTRVDAMKRAMELLKGGIHYYDGGNMESLTHLIAACMGESRPAVAKQAALLIASLAQSLEEEFSPAAETIFPVLMEQLLSDDEQIRNSSHLALMAIMKFCQDATIGKLFLDNYTSTLPNYRYIAIEAAHIILETWAPKITETFITNVEAAVNCLELDTSKLVRQVAQAAKTVNRRSEKRKKRPKSTLRYHPAPRKPLKPRPVKVLNYFSPDTKPIPVVNRKNVVDQSIPSFLPISRVMPPADDEEASVFKNLLDKVVANRDVNQLKSSVDALIPSIEKTCSVIHGRIAWETDLKFVYRHFGRELRMNIMKVMRLFDFEEWIIRIMEETYPLQIWSESLNIDNEPRQLIAVMYFSSVFQMNPRPIKITMKIRKIIEVLHRNCMEKVETSRLQAVLAQCRLGDEILDDVVRLLGIVMRDGDWNRELDVVLSKFQGQEDIAERIEAVFDDQLPSMLSKASSHQMKLIIQFIREGCVKLNNVSFYACIEPLVTMLQEGKCPFEKDAIVCISKTLSDVKSLAASIRLLEQTEGCEKFVLPAMVKHFSAISPVKMVATRKIIIRKLAPFLFSEDTQVRKSVVLIFTEFHKKIPKYVKSLFNEFTPAQQRMIEIYANPLS